MDDTPTPPSYVCKGCGETLGGSSFRTRKNSQGRTFRVGKCIECERAYTRERYWQEPEKTRARKRQFQAEWRRADPERARQYQMEVYFRNHQQNREKVRQYYVRRFFWGRWQKLRGPERATHKELARLWRAQRGRCALTGRRLTRENAELNHIVPKSRGGGDEIANLNWTTKEANRLKRNLTDDELIAICDEVIAWLKQ